MNPDIVYPAALVLGVTVSCIIAYGAGGSSGAMWGLLGPVGWIIAGLRGVQDRLEPPGGTRPRRR